MSLPQAPSEAMALASEWHGRVGVLAPFTFKWNEGAGGYCRWCEWLARMVRGAAVGILAGDEAKKRPA